MDSKTRQSRLPIADLVGLLLLAALHAWGLYGYVMRQILVPVWLWENQDYMLYLWPVYYHVHVGLMIGHMYIWGPLLISQRFRRPGWSLYWVSFIAAYLLTSYPLLQVQRFAQLHGGGAYVAVQAYAVLLVAFFLVQLLRRGPRREVIAFHLFAGLPIVLLGLQGQSTFGVSNTYIVWGLVAFHVAVASYVCCGKAAAIEAPESPKVRSRLAAVAGAVLLLALGAACFAYAPLQLLYARYGLEQLLNGVGYARTPVAPPLANLTPPPNYLRFRTYDGSWNNLNHPEIGSAGTPLGRYMPESGRVMRDVLAEPSVVRVSERLLKQDHFHSAAPFNALAMAWVNFFVHDFYNRGVSDTLGTPSDYYKIPVDGGKFLYMGKLPSVNNDGQTHVSKVTHWFDASQVYGSDQQTARNLRTNDGTGPHLRMEGEFLPTVEIRGEPIFLSGDTPRSSLHIGSMMMHHLWAREHNYIVDELHRRYPKMDDEELFQTARLIVAAEIVKVHSVEWTAELVGDPISYEFFQQFWKQFGKQQYRDDLYYAVSEEFVSSYILHEIVPPEFDLVDAQGKSVARVDFVNELFLLKGQNQLRKHGVANVLNSFGLNPMGLIHPFNISPTFRRFEGLNFLAGPGHENLIRSLQASRSGEAPEGLKTAIQSEDRASYVDLGAIPVARDRDARVPYYNDLRVKLGMPRLRSIREITNEADVQEALEELYQGDINKIEYIVGFKAESRPSNWALTPTQIRTFLPVVVYRILADRFYTKDFNATVYTEYGMQRLAEVKLYDVIKQSYGPSMLPTDRNHPIFHQWDK